MNRFLTTVRKFNSDSKTVIEAESDEFVAVTCVDTEKKKKPFYKDYFAFVPSKKEVEYRCAKFERRSHADHLNVAIIGLDALSRLNFHRQMKSSTKYLKEEMGAIEMVGYNKLGDNTFPNLVPLLMNLTIDELKRTCWPTKDSFFDDCPFIWKTFEKFGFR